MKLIIKKRYLSIADQALSKGLYLQTLWALSVIDSKYNEVLKEYKSYFESIVKMNEDYESFIDSYLKEELIRQRNFNQ